MCCCPLRKTGLVSSWLREKDASWKSELKLGSQNTSDTNCNVYFERVSYPFFLLMNSHEPRTYCRAIEELIYLTLKSISDGRYLSESEWGILIISIMFITKGLCTLRRMRTLANAKCTIFHQIGILFYLVWNLCYTSFGISERALLVRSEQNICVSVLWALHRSAAAGQPFFFFPPPVMIPLSRSKCYF